jgi:energy-converting hydrogenase A subunit M
VNATSEQEMSDQDQGAATASSDPYDLKQTFLRANKMAQKLGLYEHSLLDILRNKSDWSSIIKMHSLMEIALNRILTEGVLVEGSDHRRAAFSDFIARLPINGRNGKLRLARDLDLIDKRIFDLIERLSEIRNFYAHDIRNVSVSLMDIIFEDKRNQQDNFHKAFLCVYDEKFDLPKKLYRFYVFMAVCAALRALDTPATDTELTSY